MLKKVISYEDFNGVEQSELFYFNLSKSELAEMELTMPGGMGSYIDKIVQAKEIPELARLFKKLILQSYGVKSEDGKKFIKNEQLRDEFECSAAYDVLFMELISDADKASEFCNGILPERK